MGSDFCKIMAWCHSYMLIKIKSLIIPTYLPFHSCVPFLPQELICPWCNITITVLLISSYGAPLAQRAVYLALHSSLFGPMAQLSMIILSLTALTLC